MRPALARSWRRWLLLAAALLLNACALQQTGPGAGIDWAARRERLGALAAWEARGRIAIKSETGGGQGDLRWEQLGSATRIRVSGPFGAGAYEIRWDPARLTITSRNGEFSRAYAGSDAAEQFLAEQLGWSFPAISARYWLLGMADPAFPAEETFASGGQLVALNQNGWTMSYDRYADQAGLAMPAKITLQNSRARLRLIIDRWCLAPNCLAAAASEQ